MHGSYIDAHFGKKNSSRGHSPGWAPIVGKNCLEVRGFAFKLSHLLYGGHTGCHFGKRVTRMPVKSNTYCKKKGQNMEI